MSKPKKAKRGAANLIALLKSIQGMCVDREPHEMIRHNLISATRECARLREVCAEAYQFAGAFDAPVKVLDNLSAASAGRKLPHETFLPIHAQDTPRAEIARLEVGEWEKTCVAQTIEIERLRAECTRRDAWMWQQDAMLTVLSRALEIATASYARAIESVAIHQRKRDEASRALTDFRHDVQLVMAAGADTLCGSRWINAAGLREVLERHTEGERHETKNETTKTQKAM